MVDEAGLLPVNASNQAILYFIIIAQPLSDAGVDAGPVGAQAITTCLGDGVVWGLHVDNGN